jgi:SAM-dependent methyltransferase
MPWLGNQTLLRKILYPSPVHQSNPQIKKVLSLLSKEAKIADFGAGGRKITPGTITIDFIKARQTDIIADIHKVPIKDKSFDCIFCTGTLEHVEYPEKVVKEIRRVLKPKGIVYIDVPFIQCFHPDPVDYWRFTTQGLELLCRRNGLTKIEAGANIGAASALTWVLISSFESFLSKGIISKLLGKLFNYLVLPIKYLDKFTVKGPNHYLTPSAVFYIGTKN